MQRDSSDYSEKLKQLRDGLGGLLKRKLLDGSISLPVAQEVAIYFVTEISRGDMSDKEIDEKILVMGKKFPIVNEMVGE